MKTQFPTWLGVTILVIAGCGGKPGDSTQPLPSEGKLSLTNVSGSTEEDTPITLDLAPAIAEGVQFQVVTPPTHGTLGTLNGHVATYTPAENYFGADTFTFAAVRGDERVEASASLTITAVDDKASATADSITVRQWESVSALAGGATSVLANDADIDGGEAATATLVNPPTHGVLTLNLDGTFTYLHDGSISTSDSFSYSTAPGSQATVAITVQPELPPALLNLSFNGEVTAALHLGDAWFVGGDFTYADYVSARSLVAVDANGLPSGGCDVAKGFDNPVNSLTHIGNAIYAGGPFSSYRGQPAYFIAKIDMTTCELDTTFSPVGNQGFNGDVRRLATDGTSIFAVGTFTQYRGATANYVAKIDGTTGVLDQAFMNPNGIVSNGFDNVPLDIRIHGSDAFIGGTFSAYRGVPNSARGIARLRTDTGALVPTFGPTGPSNGFTAFGNPGAVSAIALNADASALYAAGSFNQYVNGPTTVAVNRIVKIDLESGGAVGAFSGTGSTGFDNSINTLEFTDGALFVGGAFDVYRGTQTAHRIAKLDAITGQLDATFNPQGVGPMVNGFEGNITKIVGIGGAILVGGQPLGGYRSTVDLTSGMAKLDTSTGALDPTFMALPGHDHSGFEDASYSMNAAEVVGSTIWIGGNFRRIGGKSANAIARFKDSDGLLDQSFSPPAANGFNAGVLALAASDNALYVGGYFASYRGQVDSARRLAKLDPITGAIDTTFGPVGPTANGFNGSVESLLYDAGTLYVGGSFSSYRGVVDSAWSIAKLDATSGAIDTTFSPAGAMMNGFDDSVLAITKRGNDLFVAGDFVSYRAGTDNANRIAKLNALTGELDTSFTPPANNGFDSTVHALALIGDSLYAGGDMTAYRGTADIGNCVKLSATDGTIDLAFAPTGPSAGFDNRVQTLAVSGGALYVGGAFLGYRGIEGSANFMAKLDPATGALDATFTPAGALSGYGSISVLAPYRSSILAGGNFSNCEDGVCYDNAHRFNRNTRVTQ